MEKEEKIKIKYEDLSVPLKIAAILSYVIGVLYTFAFLLGFAAGSLGLV